MADCRFESLVADLLNRTKQPCKDCMKDAGISSGDISEVLLVGGQTRMPKVFPNGLKAAGQCNDLFPGIRNAILVELIRCKNFAS